MKDGRAIYKKAEELAERYIKELLEIEENEFKYRYLNDAKFHESVRHLSNLYYNNMI